MEEDQAPPVVALTVDQVVAWNVRYWRKAAGMTQDQLGEKMGWSGAVVSAAERSVDDSRDRRRFDAQELAELCIALGVPLAALFLPPPGEGTTATYRFTAGGRRHSMDDLMMQVVMPDATTDTKIMDAYRDRWNEAGIRAVKSPEQMALVARWASGTARQAQHAAKLRREAADLVNAAAVASAAASRLAGLADQLDDGGSANPD